MKSRLLVGIALCLSFLFAGCSEEAPVETTTQVQAAQPSVVVKEGAQGPVKYTITMSPEKPVLGDQLTLQIEAEFEPDVRVDMPEFGDQLGRFGISDFRRGDNVLPNGNMVQTQTYTLDLPRSGKLKIPAFLIEYVDSRASTEPDVRGKVQEIETEDVTFEVQSVLLSADDNVLTPAKGELQELVLEEESHRYALLFMILGIVAVVAAGLGYWALRKEKVVKALAPHEIALKAIENLEKGTIPTDAKGIDAWYVEVSDIIRQYVDGRFCLSAPRLTTEEFFELAKSSSLLNDKEKELISSLLEKADRVKFTEYVPEVTASKEMLMETRRFVEETRPKDTQQSA